MKIEAIIYKIKKEDEGYNDLWREYKSLIKKIAEDFSSTYNNNYEDVRQNSYIAFRDLVDDFKLNKVESDLRTAFTAYIKKYLPLRLRNFEDSYSLFQSSKDDVNSLDNIDLENKINSLRYEKFNDDYHKVFEIEQKLHKLSQREKQVYYLLKEGYDDGYIADELGISYQNVYEYKQRMRKKLK